MTKALILILLLLPTIGYTDVYSWTDANGVKHFSDTPPENSRVKVQQTNEFVYHGGENTDHQEKNRDRKKQPDIQNKYEKKKTYRKNRTDRKPDVVMYMTPTCGYCRRAKAFFNKHGIQFVEYNIQESKKARQKFKSLNGSGVPLIFVNDKRIPGFNEPALKQALNIK